MNLIKASILTMMILSCACHHNKATYHRYVNIVNNSERTISCQYSLDEITNLHKDTVFECDRGPLGFIRKDSPFFLECPIRNENKGWEIELSNSHYLQLLIQDSTKLYQNYMEEGCDELFLEKVPALHMYRLTLEDLRRMNWTVVYPPEE